MKTLRQRYLIELEVTEGLEDLAREEVTMLLPQNTAFIRPSRAKGAVRFHVEKPHLLKQLNLAESIFLVEYYAIPRPKALLGDAHFKRMLKQIALAQRFSPEPMKTFYIAAAGSESSVMQRLKAEIAVHTGLQVSEKGDLQLRILPVPDEGGWEIHCRITPRPLSSRSWRVCWFKGALNATVAQAMISLSQLKPNDTVVNLCCGSGTLLIEAGLNIAFKRIYGIEIDENRLRCATENFAASGIRNTPTLLQGDAQFIPMPNQSVNVLLADLPFGQDGTQHTQNLSLYPNVLKEAARVARTGGRFVLITHEIHLLESLVKISTEWKCNRTTQINQRGLHPRIYVLERL
jgi:23S rRNA G2445 N2-methylase RlmL